MYVIKNALISISRAKGRNILSLILVLVVAISSCVALSIKSSADKAKDATYNSMQITAQIAMDRNSLMQNMIGDKEAMKEMMELMQEGISKSDLENYAQSDSVLDYYYSSTIALNIREESLENYSTSNNSGRPPMGGGSMLGKNSGDFTVTGYSSHNAMVNFVDGTTIVSEGSIFDENDIKNNCLVSEEIKTLNDLSLGDKITIVNPSNDKELIDFIISGFFSCESTDNFANDIYISYTSLENICKNSEEVSKTYTDDKSGMEVSTALKTNINGVYVFESPDKMEQFILDVENMGLNTDVYQVTSNDISNYEKSVLPLNNLSDFTMMFFVVVLIIGAVILVVFNLFTIRERKYEIGVLAAIGMKKSKVAIQFLSEVIAIALVAVIIGAGVGTFVSQPIANSLLESQIEASENENNNVQNNFGGNFSGKPSGMAGFKDKIPNGDMNTDVEYISEIKTTTDFEVVAQLMLIGLLLSILSSSVAIISILRYEPLKILSERAWEKWLYLNLKMSVIPMMERKVL